MDKITKLWDSIGLLTTVADEDKQAVAAEFQKAAEYLNNNLEDSGDLVNTLFPLILKWFKTVGELDYKFLVKEWKLEYRDIRIADINPWTMVDVEVEMINNLVEKLKNRR